MDFTQELKKFKSEIDKVLEQKIDSSIIEAQKDDKIIAEMLKYFKKTLLAGGKRVRPYMMYYGYLAAGGKEKQKILETSTCIEFIHSFLLMHDDIVDRDNKRHGLETIHVHYEKYATKKFNSQDAKHFGVSIAIILGDTIYSVANQILFSSEFEPKFIVKAMNKLQKIVRHTAIGEIQDILMEYKKSSSEEEIFKMYENKTAKYTFEGPFQLGALLAGAEYKYIQDISKFTIPLGIAFQLQDDFLGIFGKEEVTGKPFASDIIEGKQTVVVKRALNFSDSKQKERLKELLGKKNITKDEIEEFIFILNSVGAVKSVKKDIDRQLEISRTLLEKASISPEIKDFLFGMISYLKNRKF